MKIANVLLWTPPYTDSKAGGVGYAAKYLTEDLQSQGYEVDSIYFNSKPLLKNVQTCFKCFKFDEFLRLNEYDFIIFNTAGSWRDRKDPWWMEYLPSITKKFAVGIHDEHELRVLPYREMFFQHPKCSLLLPITQGILEASVNNVSKPYIVYPMYSASIKLSPNVFRKKVKRVITMCRMIPRKRILELVKEAENVHSYGFDLDIHGADAAWAYRLQLMEFKSDHWTYHGPFDDESKSDIFSDASYQWNAVSLKLKNFHRRLEISSIEGLSHGCCQILNKETVPEWVTSDMAVLVDPSDLRDLGEQLSDNYSRAQTMCYNLASKVNSLSSRLNELTNHIESI